MLFIYLFFFDIMLKYQLIFFCYFWICILCFDNPIACLCICCLNIQTGFNTLKSVHFLSEINF